MKAAPGTGFPGAGAGWTAAGSAALPGRGAYFGVGP